MEFESARLFPKRCTCPAMGMKIPNSDACPHTVHAPRVTRPAEARQCGMSGVPHLNHRSSLNRIPFQRIERPVRLRERKQFDVAANRNVCGNPQEIFAVLPRVVGNAAYNALLIQQIVAKARDRTHMNPAKYDRSAFPQNLQRSGNDLTRRRKNNRRIKLYRRSVKRIACPFRAKFECEPSMPFVASQRINLRLPMQRHLNRKVRRRAKTVKSEPIALFHSGESQRTKSDDS